MFNNQFLKFVRWIGYDLGITPNQITIGRVIFFVPGWLMWVFKRELAAFSGLPWQAIGFLAAIIVTIVILFDVVDGALARETNQVSKEGKALDPAVDKFITYSSLILFWPAINHLGLVILFALDIMSTFLRGVQVQGANEFGKKKALSQNLSKIFFSMAVLLNLPRLNFIGNILIWLAVILAIISVGIRIIPRQTKNPITVLIPQILTLSNLACGIFAIVMAFQKQPLYGILFTFAAMGFDLTDGAVARKLGVTSNFGKYFDTMADLISFGIAPAVIVASMANWSLPALLCGLVYISSTGLRLYDYGKSKDICPPGFFRGLPSPAAAWLVTSFILCLSTTGTFIILILASLLMCSFKVNYQHFSRALPTLSILEVAVAFFLGLIPAMTTHPITILTGPILIYVICPLWRKPNSVFAPNTSAAQG